MLPEFRRGLTMLQHWPAADIARMILDGFDDYREHFRQITDGARARFEQAQWQETQSASAARIDLYEDKVGETVERLRASFETDTLMDVSSWPLVKSAYITLIDLRFDDELSETWYNSIFCGLFSHDLISDGCMFIHTTRPSLRRARAAQTRLYKPQGHLSEMLASVFADYRFSEAEAFQASLSSTLLLILAAVVWALYPQQRHLSPKVRKLVDFLKGGL